MNIVDLQRKLIAVARANPPGDRVPYAFEKRVMACLAAQRVLDRGALWVRALWRSAVSCVALMLLLSAWSFLIPASSSLNILTSSSVKTDLTQDFEDVVFAAVDQESDYPW
jgi:hypothetical protein